MSFIISQNPQVEGVNQHRHIFDSKVPSPTRPSYLARYDSDSGLVLLNAGTAHGVTIGAEFAFYAAHADSHTSGKALHIFIVNNSASFFSTLSPANNASCPSIPTAFTIFQTKPGLGSTIRLYADHNSACLISACRDLGRLPHNVKFVNSRDHAHLELSVRDNQIVVSVRDANSLPPRSQISDHAGHHTILCLFLRRRRTSIGNGIVILPSTQKWRKSSPWNSTS